MLLFSHVRMHYAAPEQAFPRAAELAVQCSTHQKREPRPKTGGAPLNFFSSPVPSASSTRPLAKIPGSKAQVSILNDVICR